MTDSNLCDANVDIVIGIELHTWKDDPYAKGITIEDVVFSGFFTAQQCKYSFPIAIDETVSSNSASSITFTNQKSPIIFSHKLHGFIFHLFSV